jgi:hypothetical protein
MFPTVTTTDPTQASSIQTVLIKNDGLATAFTSMIFRYIPTQSMEPISNGGISLKGSTFTGASSVLLPSNDPFNTNALWVTSIDSKNLMYIIFSISKIIMNLAIIAMVIIRPFIPEWARLRAIWVGQTVIYYQLLVYSGLIPGVFGYAIDMGHEGMLKSTRHYAFGYSIPHIETSSDFTVYKFIQSGFIPRIFEECIVEVVTMVIITLVVLILKFIVPRSNNAFRVAREIKSSIFMFSYIPFVVHFAHNLISVAISKNHTIYNTIFIVIGILLAMVYFNHFLRMGQSIHDINTLHSKAIYQEGKTRIEQGLDWAFDSYISMNSNVIIRIVELVIYLCFAAIYAIGYDLGAVTAAVDLGLYVLLLLCNIHKFMTYETGTDERDTQKRITIFNLVHLVCMILNHIIYLIFWIFPGLNLSGAKILTWIWYILNFASLLVLLLQLAYRLLTIMNKPEYIRVMEEAEEGKNPQQTEQEVYYQ